MYFKPHTGYLHVEVVEDEENNSQFQWQKSSGDLVAVKIANVPFDGNHEILDKTAIVFSTMIQEFEFKKNKWKVIPDNAILGFVEGE